MVRSDLLIFSQNTHPVIIIFDKNHFSSSHKMEDEKSCEETPLGKQQADNYKNSDPIY
jgi:hypothetical protein